MTAATQGPRSRPPTRSGSRRRAPKKKPRKKNSSATGAIAHTNTDAAISAAVLCVTPRSEGSLSDPCSAKIWA